MVNKDESKVSDRTMHTIQTLFPVGRGLWPRGVWPKGGSVPLCHYRGIMT